MSVLWLSASCEVSYFPLWLCVALKIIQILGHFQFPRFTIGVGGEGKLGLIYKILNFFKCKKGGRLVLFKPLLSDMRTLVPESLPGVSHSPSPHPEHPFPCRSILNREASDLLHCILHFIFILVCWNLFYSCLYEASHRTLGRYCRDLLEHTRWRPLCPLGLSLSLVPVTVRQEESLHSFCAAWGDTHAGSPQTFPAYLLFWWCFGVLKYVRGIGHCHAEPPFKGGYYKWSKFLPYFSLDNWIVAVFDIKTVILTCWVPAGMTLDMQNCPPLTERSFYVQCSGSGEQSASILAVRYHML